MAGDYAKYSRHYQTTTTDVNIVAINATYLNVLPVKNLNYQEFIQKASLVVTTYTATTVTIVEHTTGIVRARFDIPAAPNAPSIGGAESYLIDYGPVGLGCTIGNSLDVSCSQVGVAAQLHIEAYQKLAVTVGSNSGLD